MLILFSFFEMNSKPSYMSSTSGLIIHGNNVATRRSASNLAFESFPVHTEVATEFTFRRYKYWWRYHVSHRTRSSQWGRRWGLVIGDRFKTASDDKVCQNETAMHSFSFRRLSILTPSIIFWGIVSTETERSRRNKGPQKHLGACLFYLTGWWLIQTRKVQLTSCQ